MPDFAKEILRETTRRTWEELKGEAVVTPEHYQKVFGEIRQRLLSGEEGMIIREISDVKRDVEKIREDLYHEEMSLCLNRRWLYRRKLDERQCFPENGVLVGLRLRNYSGIREEYGEMAAERVVRLFADSMRRYFDGVDIEYQAVRYLDRECLLLFDGLEPDRVAGYIQEFIAEIESKPFRHRNRRFSVAIDSAATEYVKGEPFYLAMDRIEEIFFKG